MNPFLLIARLLDIYGLVIVVYVIVTWVGMASHNPGVRSFERTLATVCEPFLSLFRRVLPAAVTGANGVDFTPLIGLLVLQIVSSAIARIG